MLHVMVTEYGLRPLVFHVDAGWNTELAVHNINCIIDGLKLELFTEVVDWEDLREFQLALFKSGMPNIDYPQDIAFVSVLYKFASQHGIKYILNGGNISTECVGYPEQYFYFADMRLISGILRQFANRPLRAYPFSTPFHRQVYAPLVHGIRRVKPLNMVPYHKASAMHLLAERYGWKPYAQKHVESRFTRFFEGYWLPTRFGYDVRRVQLSSLILTGQTTREEALQVLESPPYPRQDAAQDFEYVAAKLGISEQELREYQSLPKRFYWDYPNSYHWHRFGERIITMISGTRRGGAY
jgi:hypothetical protein